jgi:hypothetical protein
MAASVSALPRIFRWVFLVLEGLFIVGAIAICIAMLIDPRLPPGTQFGPFPVDFGGQPGSVALTPSGHDSDFTVTALRGSVTFLVRQAGGMIDVLKHYGLPVVLLHTVFFVVLFDLLRRLFRDVGRGESFSVKTVRLVQGVAGTLLVYSVVSAIAESWFVHTAFSYFAQHAQITISGTTIHLPAPEHMGFPGFHGFPFGSPVFLSGLLVLALSEVFRQGLALKSENDLTV